MAVKDSVLKALEKNRGQFISGEELATKLGVSRAAVSKAVKVLREEGFVIDAVTNKGYLMPQGGRTLTAEAIRRALPAKLRDNEIFVYEIVDSTNLQAKRLLIEESATGATAAGLSGAGGSAAGLSGAGGSADAKAGNVANAKAGHGSVVMASQQTAGRGRLGRSFYSPKDGLYMSIIIRPSFDISKSGLATVAAAAATSEAIDEVCGVSTQIKWVNDIYLDGKKICGILTEATTDFEIGQIDSLIIGIGINTTDAGFPAKLQDHAGSLGDLDGETKSKLAAKVVEKVLHYTGQLAVDANKLNVATHGISTSHNTSAHGTSVAHKALPRNAETNHDAANRTPVFLDSYRKRCMLIGRDISVYKGKYREDPTIELGGIPARALSIDDAGGLRVKYDDGTRETLNTGEVSIRYEGQVR